MNIKILDKEYPIHIGLAFVRELDKRYTQAFAGVEFGHGITKVFLGLTQYNPVAFCDFVMAGTCTRNERPTEDAIEKEMDSWDEQKVVQMYSDFLDALGESSLTKAQVGQIAITQLMIEARQMQEREEELSLQRKHIEG